MIGTRKQRKSEERPEELKGTMVQEMLTHFSCAYCKSWWTIGDAPKEEKGRHCPSCGMHQKFENVTKERPIQYS